MATWPTQGQEGHLSTWDLIKTDYCAHYSDKEESLGRRRALSVPRFLTNPSMHAAVLVRLQTRSSARTAWLWRLMLMTCHGIVIHPGIEVGPGLQLPHPMNIVVGGNTVIGAGVVIFHNVTISPSRGKFIPAQPLVVGDGVTFFTGSCAFGSITIGEGATLGAMQLLTEDLPAGSLYSRDTVHPPAKIGR